MLQKLVKLVMHTEIVILNQTITKEMIKNELIIQTLTETKTQQVVTPKPQMKMIVILQLLI
jgi:hypothetical protein